MVSDSAFLKYCPEIGVHYTPRKFTSGLHRRNGGKENCTLIWPQPHRFNRHPAEGKVHGISSFNSRSIGSNACPRDLVKPKRYTFCVRALSIKYFSFNHSLFTLHSPYARHHHQGRSPRQKIHHRPPGGNLLTGRHSLFCPPLRPFGFILTHTSIRVINGEVDNYQHQVSKTDKEYQQ